MGRLQELLRDAGAEPIQNSAELPRDHSGRMEIENRISRYEGHHKTTGAPGRLPSTNKTLDPIDRLPPELSTLFIRHALPSHLHRASDRSSRLIGLTVVSKRWQSFLCSTPVLWSEVIIDESQEDLLATVSVFVALSGKVGLQLTFLGELADWTGLNTLLLPATQRITSLGFVGYNFGGSWVPSVISTVLGRLGHLPHLNQVNFDNVWGGGNSLQAASLLLPSAIKLTGRFSVQMPESCWNSGTPGRFFDITKYNTFTNLEPIEPVFNSFHLRYTILLSRATTIVSDDATLYRLKSFARHLAEHNCFEQLVCRTAHHLRDLVIYVHLSQVREVIDCLRLLMRLQTLELRIQIELHSKALDWAPNYPACHDLKKISLSFHEGYAEGIAISAQNTLRSLFSAFETLYPSVEELSLDEFTWTLFASSYLQSLRALKSLSLDSPDSNHNPREGSLTLQSLQYLSVNGPGYLDSLRMPALLGLALDLPDLDMSPTHLSHPRIRSLTIKTHKSTQGFKVLSLDCDDLRDLRLYNIPLRVTWGLLSLPNVVSIRIISEFAGIVHRSSNQLCLVLLYYPERLPSLEQLHFDKCVDWDILFLMLHRGNIDRVEVKRISTVTLPFIPFALQQPLACLLAAKLVELPSLASLSLEATREVLFDSTVYVYIPYGGEFTHGTQSPGCFACLQSWRPGCTAMVSRRTDVEGGKTPVDDIYPGEDNAPGLAPTEIHDWLSLRRGLIDIWRASYEEFCQEFVRVDECSTFPRMMLHDEL